MQTNIENAIELQEGEYEKTNRNKNIIPDIQLRPMEDEEEQDAESVKILIDDKKMIFRYLFQTYAGSAVSNSRFASFDSKQSKVDTISVEDLNKMLKNHNVTMKMLSHLELTTLIRLLNFKLHQKNDLSGLSFEDFIELFIQLALYIYGKLQMSHLPLAILVEKLLNHFKQAAKSRGEKTNLFDNPHATSLADNELLNKLTELAENNPDFQLPEGFHKKQEKHARQKTAIKEYLEIPEQTKICAEILDSILFESIAGHIIEPTTNIFMLQE